MLEVDIGAHMDKFGDKCGVLVSIEEVIRYDSRRNPLVCGSLLLEDVIGEEVIAADDEE